jgi:hypothetical protein
MNTYQQQILSNELILVYMILIIILCKVNFFYKNNKNIYLKKHFCIIIQYLTCIVMNIILSRYHQCETPPFGVPSGDLSGRITSKIAASRRD